jgi:predicted HTH transcriptional regulator
MPRIETKADLEALHTGNIKESLHLEYKSSEAIDKKNDSKKIEMARDVSAFANADGGQIVYGMTETDHEPAGLDAGIDPIVYPEIWFEQVLQQHVTPKISGLRIHHVPLEKGSVAVVVEIPASKADPHQVSDGRYYRRHNFNRLIMEHYEVREKFRRTTTPELFVDLSLSSGGDAQLEFGYQQV